MSLFWSRPLLTASGEPEQAQEGIWMSGTTGQSPKTLVVIPALNEEASISAVVAGVRAHVPWADVLVVDDGSEDDTSRLAALAGARVARLPFNLGVGSAMRTGFRYAARGGYDAVVQVDGDGQHDPGFIPCLLAQLEHHDVVVGARFAGAGDYAASGARLWAMGAVAAVMSRLVGTTLNDATSGFRAAGPRAIQVYAQHYPAEYLGDTLESLVIARKSRLSVAQVPVSMYHRTGGRPSHGSLAAMFDLIRAAVTVTLGLVRDWPLTSEGTA